MKICDRHWNGKGEPIKGVETISMARERSEYSLCESCKQELQKFLAGDDLKLAPKKAARKRVKKK